MSHPRWLEPLVQGFVAVLTLPPNWDSYRAKTIDPEIVSAAMDFIVPLLAPATPAPQVVPLSSGGIQLEWHRSGIDLEIVFDVGDQPGFSYRRGNEEFDHTLPDGAGLLQSLIHALDDSA